MQRWLILVVGGLAAIAAWASVPPHRAKVAETSVSSYTIIDAGDIGDLPPGTEFKLSREAAEAQIGIETEIGAQPKESEQKLLDAAKLRKDAKLGGGLDLIAAYDRVKQLYSTKPYVSILPPDPGVALEGPPDEPPFVPTPVFERDESYGSFERRGRDGVVERSEEFVGYPFVSPPSGVVINR